jgi:hypothetical protein
MSSFFSFVSVGLALAGVLSQPLPAAEQEAPTGTCVGIPLPVTALASGSSEETSAGVRDSLVEALTGPSMRGLPLDARVTVQAREEARIKNCEFLLVVKVTQKRGGAGGGSRFLGRVAAEAAGAAINHSGASGAGAAAARSAGSSTASRVAGAMASGTQAKDELEIEYRFGAGSMATKEVVQSAKAKAQSDGEDLLTPLVHKIAEQVADLVVARRRRD